MKGMKGMKGMKEMNEMNERNPRARLLNQCIMRPSIALVCIMIVRSTDYQVLWNCTRQPRIIAVHHTKQWLPHRDCSRRRPSVPWRGLWVEDLLLCRAFQHLPCHPCRVLQKDLKCFHNGRHRGDTAINSVTVNYFNPLPL